MVVIRLISTFNPVNFTGANDNTSKHFTQSLKVKLRNGGQKVTPMSWKMCIRPNWHGDYYLTLRRRKPTVGRADGILRFWLMRENGGMEFRHEWVLETDNQRQIPGFALFPFDTDLSATSGRLALDGQVWFAIELEVELSSQNLDGLGLGTRRKMPTSDGRMDTLFQKVLTGANRANTNPGFLIQSNDGAMFFADRAIILVDDEGDYFRGRLTTTSPAAILNGVVWQCADFNGDVIRELLCWIYCRRFRGRALSDALLWNLLEAASLWMYPALVREIERELIKRLTPDNVFKLIARAIRFQLDDCKWIFFAFVYDNEIAFPGPADDDEWGVDVTQVQRLLYRAEFEEFRLDQQNPAADQV